MLALEMTANIASSSAVGTPSTVSPRSALRSMLAMVPTVAVSQLRLEGRARGLGRAGPLAVPSRTLRHGRAASTPVRPRLPWNHGQSAVRTRRCPAGAAERRHHRADHPVGLHRGLRARGRRHAAVPRRPRRPVAPALRVHRAHGRRHRPAPDAAPAADRRAPGRRRPDDSAVRRAHPAGFAPAGDRARAGPRGPRPRASCRFRVERRSASASATPARGSTGCPPGSSAPSTCSCRTSTPARRPRRT